MGRWAVSGGSGFVGLHLVRRLVREGRRVRSLDLERLQAAGAESLVGDVRDPRAARWLCAGADVLVHAAAALPSARSDREVRSVNVDGTETLLRAAAWAGVERVVFVSSAVVYGLQDPPLHEDMAPRPIDAYGKAKVGAERLCLSAGAVVLRPAAVVGPERVGVFGILFEWVLEGRRLFVLGSGQNRYQLLAVDDLVAAILLAADRPVGGEILNLGATKFGTVRQELEALARHAGSKSVVQPLPSRPARAALALLAAARLSPLSRWHYRSADRDVVVDIERAQKLLGWSPRRSSADALAEAYDWYAAHRTVLRPGRSHRTAWPERALALTRRLS
jgi:nucleoside-diphosphate-sugar epimerase